MDSHLVELIQRLQAVNVIIDSIGVHSHTNANNLWGLQSGGFYVPLGKKDSEAHIFMVQPNYGTSITKTQAVYNELSHDNDARVTEGTEPMNTYLELCRDINGVRIEHMSETISTYLTMHDIFEYGQGVMTVFKYNKSISKPSSILESASASSIATERPEYFVLDQGVSGDTTKEAIGISDSSICNCLSKAFDSGHPIDFSVNSAQENPNNNIMSEDTFGRMGCIFTFKSYSFDEEGRQTSITDNTVLVIGYRLKDTGYALVYVKSGSKDPVIFTTTDFTLSVHNLSNSTSSIPDLYSNKKLNLFDTFDIGVRRFLKLLCDFSYRSYSTVCKVVQTNLGVVINVPCYITKDVQSSVGHDQVIYLSNYPQLLKYQPIVIPMGFVSSSSTSAPAIINAISTASFNHSLQPTQSINTIPKLTNTAAAAYGNSFVVCAIYLEKRDAAMADRPPDERSRLISEFRNKLREMGTELYKLSSTDDIFISLIKEINNLKIVASTTRQSSRGASDFHTTAALEAAKLNVVNILTLAQQSMNRSLPELSKDKGINNMYQLFHENISSIRHKSIIKSDEQTLQDVVIKDTIEIINSLRISLGANFQPVYYRWLNGMNELQRFIREGLSEDKIQEAISQWERKRKSPDSGGSNSHKTKKTTKRSRKTRKITKRAKYIKKNVTKHRR